jgi:hypothetical protein
MPDRRIAAMLPQRDFCIACIADIESEPGGPFAQNSHHDAAGQHEGRLTAAAATNKSSVPCDSGHPVIATGHAPKNGWPAARLR